MGIETLLGETMELTRAGRGQTIAEAAGEAGVTPLTWSKLRTPGHYLHVPTMRGIADYLDVDAAAIQALWQAPARPTARVADARRDPDNLSLLGHRLDEVRAFHGETLTDVAGHLGVSAGMVSYLRRIGSGTQRRTWAALADYVGCSVAEAKAWAQVPAPVADDTRALPIRTFGGTKRVPTVDGTRGCEVCEFCAPCKADVMRGDFAWCEALAPCDFRSK